LANLIVEAQQDLPAWLEQMAQQGAGSYTSSRMSRGGVGRK
jgi:hypothetical protein